MVRAMAVVTFGVLLVGYGVAEGLWSGRWGQSDEVRQAVARLDAVPRTIGDWRGEDRPHDPQQLELAEIQGYVSREYTNRRTGARVSVLLVCGRPGPIAVHPPNICFTAQGFDMAAAPDRFGVDAGGTPAEFWTTTFVKNDGPLPESQRTFWAWSAAGPWQVPDNPRLSFARYRALYKLYVTCPTTAKGDEPADKSPAVAFIKVLLPELHRNLFPDA